MTIYHLTSRPRLSRLATVDAPAPAPVDQPNGAPEPLLLDIPAAAAFAGTKERAMRHLFTQRVFPVVALGTRLYVRRTDLLTYFDLHTQPARPVAEGR